MLKKNWIATLIATTLVAACGGKTPTTSSSSQSSVSSASSSVAAKANVIINEVVAKSGDVAFLAGNDWVELYNADSRTITLSDYTLADSSGNQAALPSLSLSAGQYIVIAAVDADEQDPPINSVPFKLGKTDTVSLWNGGMISTLSWVDGDAPEGSSYGLLNGAAQTLKPTPGGSNQKQTEPPVQIVRGNPSGNAPLRISEVVPQSDRPEFYGGDDWVELVNTGSAAVNLSEYTITDSENPLQPLPNRLVQPGEYVVVVFGDTAPTDGAPHASMGLGREDSVSLFRNNQEVDYISWVKDQSKNGRSFGRLDNQLQILYPSPGTSNVPYQLFVDDKVFQVKVDVSAADWKAMLARPAAEQYYPANFEINGAKISNVGFRIKGQGSLSFVQNSIRYGFKVDMNEYVDQKFMGMKKLVFNQSFSDPSFMRDVLAYNLMRDAGVPSPQVSYVDLWVAGEHLGLYQMVEMIDTEFLEKHFVEDQDEIGDLYKGEIGQRLLWTGSTIASYSSGLRLKTNEETIGTAEEGVALLNFLNGINNSGSPLNHINTDLTVKYLAAAVLIGNMDNPLGATANNFYLYEQRSQDIFTLLPWDFNLGFGMWGNGPAKTIGAIGGGGGFGGGFGGGGFGGAAPVPVAPAPVAQEVLCRIVNHVIDNPVHDTNSARPMFDAILKNEGLRQQYHAELQRLLDTVYNPQYMQQEINRIKNLIDPFVQADPTKFFTYQEWLLSLEQGLPKNSSLAGGRGAGIYGPAPGLLTFIRERADIVQQQLNGALPSANNGGTACPFNLQ